MIQQAFTYSDGSHVTAAGVLRADYAKLFRTINSGRELASSLRAGPYAWPGDYALIYVTHDGAALCPECVRAEYHQISNAIRHRLNDGWRVVGTCIANSIEGEEYCAHCGRDVCEL